MNRFKAEGRAGLMDGSSRPKRLYRPTPEEVVRQIERLPRQRRTGQQIAAEVGVSPATVSRVHKRLGLNRIAALEPAEPVRRYEREHPAGELIHMDIKKLGRFNQVGHRITGDRTALVKLKKRNQTGQSLGRRLGVRPCRYCRQLPHRLRQGHAKREETQCYRFLKGRGRLIAQWFSEKGALSVEEISDAFASIYLYGLARPGGREAGSRVGSTLRHIVVGMEEQSQTASQPSYLPKVTA